MNCEKYDGWYPDYRSIVVVKPIKGVDYWTDEDKKEIADEAAEQLKKSIPEIDGTLKVKGAAADAAVVGEKVNQLSKEISDVQGEKLDKNALDAVVEFSGEVTFSLNRYNPELNKGAFLYNATFRTDGTISAGHQTTYFTTPRIKVEPNTTYTVAIEKYGTPEFWYYDENNNPVKKVQYSATGEYGLHFVFTTPDYAKYIIFRCSKYRFGVNAIGDENDTLELLISNFESNFMLIYGDTYPDYYIPYSETIDSEVASLKPKTVGLEQFDDEVGKIIGNIPSSSEGSVLSTISTIATRLPLSNENWLDTSVLNYSEDSIIYNKDYITCERYFPVEEFSSENKILVESDLDEDFVLELGCCFYDENKVQIGNRSSWFTSELTVYGGASYFRICMRLKDRNGSLVEGYEDNFPLSETFIFFKQNILNFLGDLKVEGDKVLKKTGHLEDIAYVDSETNILSTDLADLKTLTISTDYNGYYSRRPFNIVHITDLHSSAGNVKCLSNAIKLLEERDELDCMFLTGDLVASHFTSENAPLESEWAKISKDVIFTVGNHDVGNGNEVAKSGTDAKVYARYYEPHLKNHFMYDANTTLLKYNASNPSDNPMMNYYADYPEYLIRVISMYQYNTDFEISSTDETKLARTRCNRVYKQSDVDWLINTLNNTPEGYTVLFMTHEPEAFGNKTNDWQALMLARDAGSWKTEGILTKILTAYKKKEMLSETFTQPSGFAPAVNVNADFRSATGIFGAWVMGHTHDDYVGKSINGEINVICKTCDNLHAQLSSSILRVKGTPNENTINIMSVDTEHRTITIKRIGAKFSRNGDWRNVTSLAY